MLKNLQGQLRRKQPQLHQNPDAQSSLNKGTHSENALTMSTGRAEGLEPFGIEEMNSRRDGGKKRGSGPTRQEPFYFKLVDQQRGAASKMQKHLSAW